MYEVLDKVTREVKGTHKTLQSANKLRDKLDNEYGSYRYCISKVQYNKGEKLMTTYITITSSKELHYKELELTNDEFKCTFNCSSAQIWERGNHNDHMKIILELEY